MSFVSFIGDVLHQTWLLAAEAGPFLVAGFLLAGLIHAFVPVQFLARWLGGDSWRSVLRAAAVGVPLPLCSCSVVPVASALRQGGASRGATTAFLISTPESGVDSIAATWALMDPLMTVIRPITAFLTALCAGAAENLWGARPESARQAEARGTQGARPPARPALGAASAPAPAAAGGDCCSVRPGRSISLSVINASPPEPNPARTAKGGTLRARLGDGLHYGLVRMFEDLGRYMIIGFLVAGLLSVLLSHWQPLRAGLDSPFMPLVMLAVGVPLYVCAASMTPMVAVLISQGLSPGAGLVFLLAGPATNAASIVLLRRIIGLRGVVIYLLSIAVCALLFGYATDGAYALLGVTPRMTAGSVHHHEHATWANTAGGVVLTVLVLNGVLRRYWTRRRA